MAVFPYQFYHVSPYMEICRGSNATSQVQIAWSAVSIPTAHLWIKVEPNSTPGCSWEGYSQTDNCNFLTEAVSAISITAPYSGVGIFSTANIWNKFFGGNCDSVASIAPYLWYASYNADGHVNSSKSNIDYIPFGGWTS